MVGVGHVSDDQVQVQVLDGAAGVGRVAVAGAEAVVGQRELFAGPGQGGPQVGAGGVGEVHEVADVLGGDQQQVQSGAGVGELVGYHCPVWTDPQPVRPDRQGARAEQADAGRLQRPHPGQLLGIPAVVQVVEGIRQPRR